MPLTITREGEGSGGRADRLAITYLKGDSPSLLTLIWNGSQAVHSQWQILPDGNLGSTQLDSKFGGPELAIAAIDPLRVISINRAGPNGKLKFESWKASPFSLSQSLSWIDDKDPDIVPIGTEPPSLAASSLISGRVIPQPAPWPGGGGPTTVKVAKGLKATISAKAGRAIVATQTPGFELRLSLWTFDNGGQVKVLLSAPPSMIAGPAKALSLTKLSETWTPDATRLVSVEVLAACATQGDALRLQRWRITMPSQGTPASFVLLTEVTAPETITEVNVIRVQALEGNQAATAVRLKNGSLKIIAWRMDAGGGITRLTDISGPAILSLSSIHLAGRYFVTALRVADGTFRGSYWRFPATANGSLAHQGDVTEGAIGSFLHCAHVPAISESGIGRTIFATQTTGGDLRLFHYRTLVK